ncbi:nucleoside hydrolase [Embleya hyalina]|uniref:Ribosylpyrimidine nucleosidase n=1 Tax=Embleya hyalina TaxID=516124 RepID=A0A401YND8_9ACTN|nr:nucleoside hydrolase [Embleya hyalina]GCD96116.1 ribosylpyrimidine nucleosidase [Embleya hyalina]
MAKRPVLIDTDTGVDDGMGVIYALNRPELDVVGVTTVFGNVSVEQVTRNSLLIQERLDRRDVPVAQGAAKGLLGSPEFHAGIHGRDGIGESGLVPADGTPDPRSAVRLILDLSHRYAGELEVIALGPLTNVAIALLVDPALARRLRRVVWMGGAVASPGNVSAVAEADAAHDPEGAQVVLESGVPVTLVPLDVTDATLLREADLERIKAGGTAAGALVAAFAPFYMEFYSHRLGEFACAMHSPLTVGIVARPDLIVRSGNHPTAIELAPGLSRGATVVDRRVRPPEQLLRALPARIIEEVDHAGFIEDFVTTITSTSPAAP